MKYRFAMILAWIGLFAGTALLPAQNSADTGFTAKEPVLLTSAGQSADSQIVKVLLERNKIGVGTVIRTERGSLSETFFGRQ